MSLSLVINLINNVFGRQSMLGGLSCVSSIWPIIFQENRGSDSRDYANLLGEAEERSTRASNPTSYREPVFGWFAMLINDLKV